MFLREALLTTLDCDERQLTLAGGDASMPLTLNYTDTVALGRAAAALAIFPIDLARYPQAQVQAWVNRHRSPRVLALHERSADALRKAGYRGHIARLPVPGPTPQPATASDTLALTQVFSCIDSCGRPYDPEWLLPGDRQPAEEVAAAAPAPAARPDIRSPRPDLRFRVGATKRHLLNLIAAWRTPSAASAAADPQPSPLAQPLHLTVGGCVFTMVLDEFSEESGWTDAVKAFCHAFRAQRDATLLIVLPGGADEQHARDFDHVLCGLYLFACRLILVQATLSEADYRSLIACTDVYLDNHRRETLQADLRCFAAAGVATIGYLPQDEENAGAVALDHTLRYCREPACHDFSDDPRYHTDARRLDWESLLAALTAAHARATAIESRNDRRLPRATLLPAVAQRQQMWRQAVQDASLQDATA